MRKLMPISSAVAAMMMIASVLSGCGRTGVEHVTEPTTTSGAAQTNSAAQTTDSAAATAAAQAVKAAEAATVAEAKIAADTKAAAVAKAATAAKAKAAAAKAKTAAVPPPVPATLRETCSKVEKAVSGLTGKSSPNGSPTGCGPRAAQVPERGW